MYRSYDNIVVKKFGGWCIFLLSVGEIFREVLEWLLFKKYLVIIFDIFGIV